MRRGAGVAIAVAVLAVASLGAAGGGMAYDDDGKDERRVEVIRIGGGARLGVVLDDVGADDVARLKLGEERGALVKEVAKGSAAEKAGLKADDVILSFQGERVHSSAQLRRLVHETPSGRKVAIEVSRGGAPQRVTATLEDSEDGPFAMGPKSFHFDVPVPPVPPVPPIPPLGDLFDDGDKGMRFHFRDRFIEGRPGRLGITYQALSGQLARYFKVEDGTLLVTDVEADGPAAKAGIRAGDVIVKVEGKAVTESSELRRALDDVPSGREVGVTVQRDGRPLDLKVTLRGERRARATRPSV
jgi:serine protease Do